jgi:hypothetical protein
VEISSDFPIPDSPSVPFARRAFDAAIIVGKIFIFAGLALATAASARGALTLWYRFTDLYVIAVSAILFVRLLCFLPLTHRVIALLRLTRAASVSRACGIARVRHGSPVR